MLGLLHLVRHGAHGAGSTVGQRVLAGDLFGKTLVAEGTVRLVRKSYVALGLLLVALLGSLSRLA